MEAVAWAGFLREVRSALCVPITALRYLMKGLAGSGPQNITALDVVISKSRGSQQGNQLLSKLSASPSGRVGISRAEMRHNQT